MNSTMLILLLPVILLEYGLAIYALVKLYKKERVKYMNKIIWTLIILFIGFIGAILFLIFENEQV